MAADATLLQSIAFLGAAVLGTGIVALGAAGLWRAMTDDRPLLLSELIAFEGVRMAEHVRGAGAREFALAARKCMACAERSRCQDWLAGPRDVPYDRFCPNAGYLARLGAERS